MESQEKLKIEFVEPKSKFFDFCGKNIEVKPYLLEGEQILIIKDYIETYFKNEFDYFGAERQFKTNVFNYSLLNVETIDSRLYDSSDFFEQATKQILNYRDFRISLNRIISDVKEERALNLSLGKVLNDVSNKLICILDKLGSMTPEDVSKMKDDGLQMLKSIEDSSASNLFKESQGKPSVKKKSSKIAKNTAEIIQ